VGPHRPDETRQRHAVDVFLQPLERLAIFDADRVPRLNLPDLSFDALPSGNWLALHPGSGSERKNWPERNWAELLKYLVESTDFGFLLVGGEAEGERLDRLAAALPPHRINWRSTCRWRTWHSGSNTRADLSGMIRESRTWRRQSDCPD
jgi:ADP-heptose:LPS heptosyltransferase